MSDPSELERILMQLQRLKKRQQELSEEIHSLTFEIGKMHDVKSKTGNTPAASPQPPQTVTEFKAQPAIPKPTPPPTYSIPNVPRPKSDLEKFIGENLINKIGILITIIGVAIGARYAIDHQLISPLTRIILGYIVGFGLLAFAFRLKEKYKNYSAVLLSGAMAIFYFLTFAAYSYYDLIPQVLAFGLMVIFTCFTVFAALIYNLPLIAHIGLVGAYGVPFLLSDGSGRVAILFSYITIINIGILVLAFKKYWKSLYYAAFGLTWFIYTSWRLGDLDQAGHFNIALVFLAIFFAIFYITLLAYKSLRKEELDRIDVVMLLSNSFIFYVSGYFILDEHPIGTELLGLFTLLNGIIHMGVATMVHRLQLTNRNLFYLMVGLALTFLTITIPVQLNGHFVTLLWTSEALVLFWIARKQRVSVYEQLSFILMGLSVISMLDDWSKYSIAFAGMETIPVLTPVLNMNFLTSLLFASAFGFVTWVNLQKQYATTLNPIDPLIRLVGVAAPAIMILGLFIAFRLEITNYFSVRFQQSAIQVPLEGGESYSSYNNDIMHFQDLWLFNYAFAFFTLLAWLDLKRFHSKQLGLTVLGLIALSIFLFLTQGLYALSALRETYLNPSDDQFIHNGYNIGIRYVAYAMAGISIWTCYRCRYAAHLREYLPGPVFDTALHVTLVWLLSSELINLMDLAHSEQSYRFGLSILWGTYSFLLIALGIWKKRKHLRVMAIILFGVTLIKLFVYDISALTTIAKTIAFVSLGILLLIISFLYNKYKQYLNDDEITR